MHLVAYYRVSTDKQGVSGLGLEGQQETVRAYAKSVGGLIIQSFIEVESGRKADRPELAKAIKFASKAKATLCVAKLDRLSRNVLFLATLMESKVPFVAVDNPNANPFTLHILAAVAEHEAKAISERTKAALRAYKARGGVLGGARPESTGLPLEAAQRGREAGCKALRKRALDATTEETAIALRLRSEGLTLDKIAETLNAEGFTTSTHGKWSKVQVYRMLKRSDG